MSQSNAASPSPMLSINDDSSMAARQAAEERAQGILDNAWTEALETLQRHKQAHSALVDALYFVNVLSGTSAPLDART